jgi:hypothetical protein
MFGELHVLDQFFGDNFYKWQNPMNHVTISMTNTLICNPSINVEIHELCKINIYLPPLWVA